MKYKREGSTPVALKQTTKICIRTFKDSVLTAQLPSSENLFLATDSHAAHTSSCILKHKHAFIYKSTFIFNPSLGNLLKFFLHPSYRCAVSHGCQLKDFHL